MTSQQTRPPTKHMRTIRERAEQRLRRGESIEQVARYLVQALPDVAHIGRIQPGASLALQKACAMGRTELIQRREEKTKAQARAAAEVEERRRSAEAQAKERWRWLHAQVEQKRAQGQLTRWLASLPPEERKRLGTPAERKEAVALRKRCLKTGAVRDRLQCSLTELNRWDAEGLLPHLYTRKMPLSVAGRAVSCRFWLEDDVAAAADCVAQWREAYQQRKRAKKQKLRVVRRR